LRTDSEYTVSVAALYAPLKQQTNHTAEEVTATNTAKQEDIFSKQWVWRREGKEKRSQHISRLRRLYVVQDFPRLQGTKAYQKQAGRSQVAGPGPCRRHRSDCLDPALQAVVSLLVVHVVLVCEMGSFKQMHSGSFFLLALLNEMVAVRKKSRLRRAVADSKKIQPRGSRRDRKRVHKCAAELTFTGSCSCIKESPACSQKGTRN
jgi:hypothetical protein